MTGRFGKYEIISRIGEGGMATVMLARPIGKRRLVALKQLKGELANDRRHVRMFLHEGRLALRLRHPSICRAYELGKVGQQLYICMEYVPGVDLSRLIRRCRVGSDWLLPVPHALHIACCICEALHYTHELTDSSGASLKIVNRDVSPSNVRISFKGQVKLIDFGIAKATSTLSSEIGVLAGKVGHMSPEQVRGLPLDRRSDVFSASIVLHEMLVGARLFRRASEIEQMEAVRQAVVPVPSEVNPRVPPSVDQIVLRGLAKDPQARYQTAVAMAVDLHSVLEHYRFDSAELRDLVRSRCAAEWSATRLLLDQHVADQEADLESAEAARDAHTVANLPTEELPPRAENHAASSQRLRSHEARAAGYPSWVYALLGVSLLLVIVALVIAGI